MTANGVVAWTDLDNDGVATATLNSSAGQPGADTVTSSTIVDLSIMNADINAAAAIAVSKLAPGTAAQILTTTSGTAVWATPASSAPSGAAGGDLSGTYPNPTVAKLDGVAAASYALLTSPTFAGTPTLPTATVATTQSAADSTTKLATTAFVTTADNLKANLASPTLTGVPAAPTAAVDTNTTQLATTAYVVAQAYAKLASPTFTGTPVLPTGTTGTTQTAADNSTKLATTAYVDAKERAFLFGKAGAIGATETNAADFPFIVPFASTMKRCKVVLGSAASGAMTVQIRKASAPGTAVPSYADVTGFIATFANGSQIATFTLGTAVTAAEGDLLNFSCATGSGSNMMVEVVTV